MQKVREALRRLFQSLVSGKFFDLPPMFQIRCAVYRAVLGAGEGFTVGRNCFFICADFYFESHKLGKLKIGRNVAINHNVEVDFSGGLTLEDEVWISQDVLIETHDHDIGTGLKKDWPLTRSPLVIGKDAWIGAKATVTSSVSYIGEGAIVGAGAVVTKNVEPYTIVAGVPAKVISTRPRG